MMKIVLLFNSWEHFSPDREDLAQTIAKNGHSVQVWVPPHSGPVKQAMPLYSVHPYPLSRKSLNPLSALRTFRALRRQILTQRPDLIHCFAWKPILLGGLASHSCRVPVLIAHFTGLGSLFLSPRLLLRSLRRVITPIVRWILRKEARTHVFCIFQNLSDQERMQTLLANRLPPSAMIAGNGLDLSQFPNQANLDGTPPTLLFAGRLLADKGVREWVEAVRLLRQRGLSFRAVLLGGIDPQNPSAVSAEEVKTWQEQDQVEWLGHISDPRNVFLNATLFCLPSYGEGFSRVLMEAAACGLPSVTTDVPGCRDAVAPGITALIVPPRDIPRLADALEKLLRDPDLCRKMGHQARLYAESHFDRSALIEQVVEIYRRVDAL